MWIWQGWKLNMYIIPEKKIKQNKSAEGCENLKIY